MFKPCSLASFGYFAESLRLLCMKSSYIYKGLRLRESKLHPDPTHRTLVAHWDPGLVETQHQETVAF